MIIVNDIVDWLISGGGLTALFIFAWKYVKPWLDSKAAHASTEQSKANWALLEQVSKTVVESLVSSGMIGSDKYVAAIKQVSNIMEQQGEPMGTEAVESAVQSAYEKSPLTGNNKEEN